MPSFLLWSILFACGSAREPVPAPTRPVERVESGPASDLNRVLIENRVPKLNADGTRADPPLTPLQAAAIFGGIVMLVGGLGALWLWRRSDVAEETGPEGVVRNSAGPPGSLR